MSKQIYEVRVSENGSTFWYQNNQLHRKDGPAVEYAGGTKFWYRNGQFHREDGPAIEYANGDKAWYRNGQFHREDGPAVECADGGKRWYLNSIRLTEEEFDQKMSKRDDCTGKIVEIDGKKYELHPVEK